MLSVRKTAALAASFVLTISLAVAEDEVQRRTAPTPLRGTITAENSNEITIQRKDNGKTETVAVPDVVKVKYEGGKSAAGFSHAESLEKGGEYQKAIDAYGKIAEENSGKEFLSRAASFGRVSSMVRQAQRDPAKLSDAITALEDFRKQHPDSRYHYNLHEMLGQLYLAKGDPDAASAAFGELGKAPWPELKLKSTNYAGRILLLGNQLDAAIAKFDTVIKSAGDAPEEAIRKFEAQLGKAECLIKMKQHADAEKILRDTIANVSADESTIQAPAHNFLGDTLRETGRADEAIFEYLRVDFYFSRERDEHAKALCYIALLFEQRGQNDRAEDFRSRLKKDYPSSPWVRVGESGGK
jgi:tetratricopeptide (TPR) repeat protein